MSSSVQTLVIPDGLICGDGNELVDCCAKEYFGYLVVAYTCTNSIRWYRSFPWNFAIYDEGAWVHFWGIPNKVETRRKALKRGWYRAKWLSNGTWRQHYSTPA